MSEYLKALKKVKYNSSDEVVKAFDIIEQALQRLESIDKLQEKIGCPLDVLFKALANEIYDADGFYIALKPYLVIIENDLFVFDVPDADDWIYLKDYKKTWYLKEDKSE